MAWLDEWRPEDESFWTSGGNSRAWWTLAVTTFSLIASFATWFVFSAVAVRLPAIGFKFDTLQLFWLTAMPGLSGGSLRLVHTFLIPLYGTRNTLTVATFLKVVPMVWLGYAVQDPGTPYAHFLAIAFLCGMGGGDFSSFMPSTSIFFPKRLQGTAMGIQAGVGNFGVSLTQFITPWIVAFPLLTAFGGPETLTKAEALKMDIAIVREAGIVREVEIRNPDLVPLLQVRRQGGVVKDAVLLEPAVAKGLRLEVRKDPSGAVTELALTKVSKKAIWLQNGAFWYVPYLLVAGLLCWFVLKSIPGQRPPVGQMVRNMTNDKHVWFCVVTYVMTFGSFSGLSAAFPLMIKSLYGGFDGAPDPLKYAFLGPLVGSAIRFLGGPLSDRFGGSIWTQVSGLGLIAGCLVLIFGGYLTPTSMQQFQGFVWIMLGMFLMTGIGNFATFRQYPIIFAYSPRQGAQVLGWTGAWAAYGPLIFSSLIGGSISRFGSAIPFFWGALAFYAAASAINYWYYTRPDAERYDFGTWKGTWWDKAKDTWPGA